MILFDSKNVVKSDTFGFGVFDADFDALADEALAYYRYEAGFGF